MHAIRLGGKPAALCQAQGPQLLGVPSGIASTVEPNAAFGALLGLRPCHPCREGPADQSQATCVRVVMPAIEGPVAEELSDALLSCGAQSVV